MKKSLNLLNIFISISISLIFIFISSNDFYWTSFWNFLKIPYQLPVFSDLDSINRALLSLKEGYNPYLENPNDISGSRYIYPKTWLYLFDILRLENQNYFKLFCFIIITLYFYSILDISSKINNKFFLIITLIFLFSKINLLLLERLNIDIVIFILSWITVYYSKFYIKLILYLLSFSLKIYPLFSIFIFIEDKKRFYFILSISLMLLFIFKDQILLMKSNMIPYAMLFAYGFETLARGIYHYSMNINFLINDENYVVFKNVVIFFGGIYSLIIFFIGFKLKEKILRTKLTYHETLFLLGGGIYVGTYLISTNIDFRLIFLFFTIPLMFTLKRSIYIQIYVAFCLICMNALIFESGDRYSIEYIIKSILIHGMKLYIYTFIVYYFAIILNKFIKLKLFNYQSNIN
tara:strand:- start:1669 stop:2883 length:1215 start_codon:yes stop_codon:yes gene_type:complete